MPECKNCGKPIEAGELCADCAAVQTPVFPEMQPEEMPFGQPGDMPFAQPDVQPLSTAAPVQKKRTSYAGIIALLILLLAFAGATLYIVLAFGGVL